MLKTSWVDIQKAFDSIKHDYMLECLSKLAIPECLINSVKRLLKHQTSKLMIKGELIGYVNIKRGIIQGDSLSPLLFTIAMEPLSRCLNSQCSMIESDENLRRNHLIFVDDIKIFAISEEQLEHACNVTLDCLNKMSFTVNEKKSASNIDSPLTFGESLASDATYKYLGSRENGESIQSPENIWYIKNNITSRTEKLCATKLNAKNLFAAINEWAISSINYYIGVINFNPKELDSMNLDIRRILLDLNLIRKSANVERLYLPRNDLGRGLTNILFSAELIAANLHLKLRNDAQTASIILDEIKKQTFLGNIIQVIDTKYDILLNEFSPKMLKKAQLDSLREKISSSSLHSVLRRDPMDRLDFVTSSTWLRNGQHSVMDEALWAKVQDCNLFPGQPPCRHCHSKQLTVDHLATRCNSLVNFHYRRRHDLVVKSLHLHIARQYGLTNNASISKHKLSPLLSNNKVTIRCDVPILTHVRTEFNKPDLCVIDHVNKEITIIEVGITNSETLVEKEIEKLHKYSHLANDLLYQYEAKSARCVPIVLSWDGLVTKHFRRHAETIKLKPPLIAHIQRAIIKATSEWVIADAKL